MYLDGRGGNLEVVKSPQGALSIREVGSGQLMEQLQRHHWAVAVTLRLLIQLLLVQENGQRLLSCGSIINQYIQSVFKTPIFYDYLIEKTTHLFYWIKYWIFSLKCSQRENYWRVTSIINSSPFPLSLIGAEVTFCFCIWHFFGRPKLSHCGFVVCLLCFAYTLISSDVIIKPLTQPYNSRLYFSVSSDDVS